MALDINAFQTAVYAHSENGVLRLSKDGQSLENIGTGTLGSLRVKFVRDGEQNRQVREQLFTAIRSSLIEGTSSPNFAAFMKGIAGRLGLSVNDKGELLTGQGNPAVQDKPLMRREVAAILRQTSAARDSGAFDPAWMRAIRRNVGGFTWHHENMKDKLRTAGWSSSDKVREAVVAALLKNSEDALALAGKKPESKEEQPKVEQKPEQQKIEQPPADPREVSKNAMAAFKELKAASYERELAETFSEQLRPTLQKHFRTELAKVGFALTDNNIASLRLATKKLEEGQRQGFAQYLQAADEVKTFTDSDRLAMMKVLDLMPDEVLELLDEKDPSRLKANHKTIFSLVAGVAAECGLTLGREELPEGESQSKSIVPDLLDGVKQNRGGMDTVNELVKGQVKSVRDNPGAGHCFFYSALDQMEKVVCAEPTSLKNATELRRNLVDHARKMKDLAQAGTLGEHGLRVKDGVWSVPSTSGRRVVNEAVLQLDSKEFRDGAEWADYSQAAFLADMLQRPVSIVSPSILPGYVATFDRDLTTGKKLSGAPIFIEQESGHFRACEIKNEM